MERLVWLTLVLGLSVVSLMGAIMELGMVALMGMGLGPRMVVGLETCVGMVIARMGMGLGSTRSTL